MRQRLAADALQKNAANADEVGRHDAERGERDKDVEGGCRSRSEQTKNGYKNGHDADGVEGSLPVVVHVSNPGSTGQPAVTGESLGSTGTSRKGRHVPKIHQDPQDDVEEEVETSRSSSVERYDEGHST